MVRRAMLLVAAGGLAAACSPPPLLGPPPLLWACDEDPEAACYLQLEAEAFQGGWSVQHNLRAYYGIGFVTSNVKGAPAPEPMVAQIALPPGRYTAWTRAFSDGLDRRWRLEVGTATLAATHAGVEGAAPGFQWARAGQVDVEGGRVELRLVDEGDSWEVVDAVVLTNQPQEDPRQYEAPWRIFAPEEAASQTIDEIIQRAEGYAAQLRAPADGVAWLNRREVVRAQVLEALGLELDAPRTPLDAQFVGEVAFDGYRIQRLVFESRPGMLVTAHVYVPDGPGPFPTVLSPIGHYFDWGKADHRTATRAHGLAKQGVLTLLYDAFGQGERDVGGHSHQEHWRLLLTGHTNMSVAVWDSVRALDYLETRADVDMSRLVVTGASGGGLNSLYLSVVDPRLAASAPAAFVTQLEAIIASKVEHDPCALLPGLAGVTNAGEIGALFAPKPQLWMAAEEDPFFPVEGAQAAYEQAQEIYGVLGAQDDLRFLRVAGSHGYTQPMREALYGFMRGLAGGADAPVPEPALSLPARDDPALRCVEGGKLPDGGLTPARLGLGWTQAAQAALPGPEGLDVAATRTRLQALLQGRVAPFTPEVEPAGLAPNPFGLQVEKLKLRTGPGTVLPAYLHRGPAGAPVVVIVDSAVSSGAGPLAEAARRGLSALYVSTRGRGELEWDEYLVVSDNLMLGDPVLGQRALDLVAVRAALRADPELADAPAVLLALGEDAGLVGLYAQAAFAPYEAAVIGPTAGTYLEAHDRGMPLMSHMQGILRVADLPHVAALAAERPLVWATRWEGVAAVYPAWAAALRPRVGAAERLSLDEALGEVRRLLGEAEAP